MTQCKRSTGHLATTQNIFLILMFNADADKRSDTFGEVADIRYTDIAEWIEKKESTVTAKYQHRIIELQETLERQLLASLLDVSRANLDVLNKMDRLEKLQAEYTAHTPRHGTPGTAMPDASIQSTLCRCEQTCGDRQRKLLHQSREGF